MNDQFSDAESVQYYTDLVDDGLFPHERDALEYFGDPPGRILDLGCGAGRTTKHLVDAGFAVVGVDISAHMIEKARELVPGATFQVESAECLSFEDETFDHVLFSYNGLDYIPSEAAREAALSEVWRVLEPGGCFAFSSHNARRIPGSNLLHPMGYVRSLEFWLSNIRAGQLGSPYKYSYDTKRYQITPAEQRAQFRDHGFEPVETLTRFKFGCLACIDPWPYYVARRPGGGSPTRRTELSGG